MLVSTEQTPDTQTIKFGRIDYKCRASTQRIDVLERLLYASLCWNGVGQPVVIQKFMLHTRIKISQLISSKCMSSPSRINTLQ